MYRKQYIDARRERTKEFLDDYKMSHGCSACGYAECPAALEFHHLDPEDKKFGINVCSCHSRSMESVLEEIAKCDVLCANCHREKHWKNVVKSV